MLTCDKCGNKLSYKERGDSDKVLIIYGTEGTYIGHHLDLCNKCQRLFETYKNKMESYFMVTEDPMKIFEDNKFWDSKNKFK